MTMIWCKDYKDSAMFLVMKSDHTYFRDTTVSGDFLDADGQTNNVILWNDWYLVKL